MKILTIMINMMSNLPLPRNPGPLPVWRPVLGQATPPDHRYQHQMQPDQIIAQLSNMRMEGDKNCDDGVCLLLKCRKLGGLRGGRSGGDGGRRSMSPSLVIVLTPPCYCYCYCYCYCFDSTLFLTSPGSNSILLLSRETPMMVTKLSLTVSWFYTILSPTPGMPMS